MLGCKHGLLIALPASTARDAAGKLKREVCAGVAALCKRVGWGALEEALVALMESAATLRAEKNLPPAGGVELLFELASTGERFLAVETLLDAVVSCLISIPCPAPCRQR